MSPNFKLILWIISGLACSIQAINLRDKFNDGPSKTYVNGNGNIVINLFHIDVHGSNSSATVTSVVNDSLNEDSNKMSPNLTSNHIGMSRTGPLIQIVLDQAQENPPKENFEDHLEAYSKANPGRLVTSEPDYRRTANDLDLQNSLNLANFEITLPYEEENFVTEIPRPMSFHSWYHELLYSDKKKMMSRYSDDGIVDTPRIEKFEGSGINNVENKEGNLGVQYLSNNSFNDSSRFKSNFKDTLNSKAYININFDDETSRTVNKILNTSRDVFKAANVDVISPDSKVIGINKGAHYGSGFSGLATEDQKISENKDQETNPRTLGFAVSSASIENVIVKNKSEDSEDSVERTFMGNTTVDPFIKNLSRGDPHFSEKYLYNNPSLTKDIESFMMKIDVLDFTPVADATSIANNSSSASIENYIVKNESEDTEDSVERTFMGNTTEDPFNKNLIRGDPRFSEKYIYNDPSLNKDIESFIMNIDVLDFTPITDATSITNSSSSASIENYIVKNESQVTEDSVERTFMGNTTEATMTDATSITNDITSLYTSSPEKLLNSSTLEYLGNNSSINEEFGSSTLNYKLTDVAAKTDTLSIVDDMTHIPYTDSPKQLLTSDYDEFYSQWIEKTEELFRSKSDNPKSDILTSKPPIFILQQNRSSSLEKDYKNVFYNVQSMTTRSGRPVSFTTKNDYFKNYPESTTSSEFGADQSRYVIASMRPNYNTPLINDNSSPILPVSYFSDEWNNPAKTKKTPNPLPLKSTINIPLKNLSTQTWSFDKTNLLPSKPWKVTKFKFNLTAPKHIFGNIEANKIQPELERQRTADNVLEAFVSDLSVLENNVEMKNNNSETVANKLSLNLESVSADLPVANSEDEKTIISISKGEPVTIGQNIGLANSLYFDNVVVFPHATSGVLGNLSITTEPIQSTTVVPKTKDKVSILDFVLRTIGNSVILKTRRKPHRIKRKIRTLRNRENARSFGILASIKSGLLPRPAFPVGLVVPFQNPQSNPPMFTLPSVNSVMPGVSPNPLPIQTTVAPFTNNSPFVPPTTFDPALSPFPVTEEPEVPNQACCSSTRLAQAYFSNPRYPSSDVSSNSLCSVTVTPRSESICQLKVEFLVGRFLSPSNGVCENQALSFSGTIWPLGVKAICGFNDGQHIYIHIDRSFPLSQRHVNFILRTSTSGQNYIMYLSIQQIDCSSSFDVQAPPGCLQYFTANSGSFSSFNFANGQYLSDTNYKICFYAPRNNCKIIFSSSKGYFMLEKFGSNELIPHTHSGVSSKYCVQDYLLIPNGSANGESPTQDRYCGGALNPNHGLASYQPIAAKLNGPVFTIEVKTAMSSTFFAPAHTGFSVNYQLISSKCHNSVFSEPCKVFEAPTPPPTINYTSAYPTTDAPPIPTTAPSFTASLAYGLPKPKPVYGAPMNNYGPITHEPSLHEGHHLPLPSKGSYGVPQRPKDGYGIPKDTYSVPQSSYSATANGGNQEKIDINELFNYFQQLQYWTSLFQNSQGSNNQNYGSQWLENNGDYDGVYNFPKNHYEETNQKLSYGLPSNQYPNFGNPINSSSNGPSSNYGAPINSSNLSRGKNPLFLPQSGPPSFAKPQFNGKQKYTALSPGLLPPDPIEQKEISEGNDKLSKNEIRKKSIDIDSDYYDERR